jgi:hypothetical protein
VNLKRTKLEVMMEKVINLLYDIEEKAHQIVNRAMEEKVSLHAAFDKNLEQLDQTIAADNAAKLSVLQAQIDKELAQEKQSLIDDCNKQLASLEEHYKRDHDAIVEKTFHSLIQS